MDSVSVCGGSILNGNGLRRSLLREGGASVISWLCLLLAAESLGFDRALFGLAIGFGAIAALAFIVALLPGQGFSQRSFRNGLAKNLVPFMMLPFLLPFMVLWLLVPYSHSPDGLGDARVG